MGIVGVAPRPVLPKQVASHRVRRVATPLLLKVVVLWGADHDPDWTGRLRKLALVLRLVAESAVEDVALRLPSQVQLVRAAALRGEGTVEVAEVVLVLGGDEIVLGGSVVEGSGKEGVLMVGSR